MGFFKKVKDFFSTEEQSKPEEVKPSQEGLKDATVFHCTYCQGTIDAGEYWTKQQGKYFHKPCYKRLKSGKMSWSN